jgi:hypothetical protein
MISKIHRALDPLDVEILERAFDEAWTTFKEGEKAIESDCDQALEAALHRELIEIARLYGVTESDTLGDARAAFGEVLAEICKREEKDPSRTTR